ncbi:MAG: histidine phosphatase family protein [Blastocatellia bacterium]
MSTIYLIRHGQAGTRENYDVLSTLGREQARLLGAHFAERKMGFDSIYAGGLNRQQETARMAVIYNATPHLSHQEDERMLTFR